MTPIFAPICSPLDQISSTVFFPSDKPGEKALLPIAPFICSLLFILDYSWVEVLQTSCSGKWRDEWYDWQWTSRLIYPFTFFCISFWFFSLSLFLFGSSNYHDGMTRHSNKNSYKKQCWYLAVTQHWSAPYTYKFVIIVIARVCSSFNLGPLWRTRLFSVPVTFLSH